MKKNYIFFYLLVVLISISGCSSQNTNLNTNTPKNDFVLCSTAFNYFDLGDFDKAEEIFKIIDPNNEIYTKLKKTEKYTYQREYYEKEMYLTLFTNKLEELQVMMNNQELVQMNEKIQSIGSDISYLPTDIDSRYYLWNTFNSLEYLLENGYTFDEILFDNQVSIRESFPIISSLSLLEQEGYSSACQYAKIAYTDLSTIDEVSFLRDYTIALCDASNSWVNDKFIYDSEDDTVENLTFEIEEKYSSLNGFLKDMYNQTDWEKLIHEAKKESDRLSALIKSTPTATTPQIGMNESEARAIWGRPTKINTTKTAYGTNEQWIFTKNRYLYLDDGIVTAIQESN